MGTWLPWDCVDRRLALWERAANKAVSWTEAAPSARGQWTSRQREAARSANTASPRCPQAPHILWFPFSPAPPGDIPSVPQKVFVEHPLHGRPVSASQCGGRFIKSKGTHERFQSLGGPGGGRGSFYSGGTGKSPMSQGLKDGRDTALRRPQRLFRQ